METGYGFIVQVCGALEFPGVCYTDLPQVVQAEQVNIEGNASNVVMITGTVVTQITGDFVNGVNINFPNVR